MNPHPRREFLLRVLAACGTPLFAATSARADEQAQVAAHITHVETAASYFGATANAARTIGHAYMRHLQSAPTQALILKHASGVVQILASAGNQRAALAALVSAVRRDFAEGRVLTIEGWVLSRTEVELCTLTLLSGTN